MKRFFKPLAYALFVLAALLIQSALPAPWGIHPPALMAAAAVIAFGEGAKFGGVCGAVCGIFCDWLSAYTVAFFTVTLMTAGVCTGLFVERAMRRNVFSCAATAAVNLICAQSLFALLHLMIPRGVPPREIVMIAAPEFLMGLGCAVVFYFLQKAIHSAFEDKRVFKWKA